MLGKYNVKERLLGIALFFFSSKKWRSSFWLQKAARTQKIWVCCWKCRTLSLGAYDKAQRCRVGRAFCWSTGYGLALWDVAVQVFFSWLSFPTASCAQKKDIPCVSSLHLGATRGLRRFDRVAHLERLLAALPAHRAACMFFVVQTFCERDKKYENGTYFMHRCGMS